MAVRRSARLRSQGTPDVRVLATPEGGACNVND